ncbi:hypothetical protein TWF730_000639 [Orbilia blumenaviensis]|uniref:Uncharacterized protein n=1 Tax=Orbilia blumenaviensis TaxID=1796055 RepID=A0AAV9VP93_9PEZI
MYQDMLITLSATPGLPDGQSGPQAQPLASPSALPPYTQTPSSVSIKFELSYPPPTLQNPIVPIYRSQGFLSPLSNGSPPEYRRSLQNAMLDPKPAYTLHFDPSTQNTILATPDGQKLSSISFLKPRRQTITTFEPADGDAQTLAGSSFTLADEDHILLQSETLSNDDEDDDNDDYGAQEEVGSILIDAAVPTRETITLSSHKYFHPKGTKFTAQSGNSYRWQKSINTSTPPISPTKGMLQNARPHSTFVLTCSPPKSQRTPGSKKIVGRISISESKNPKAILELKGQEELSEAVFLGSAVAMLKKVELKAARQKAQRTIPQNMMQLTF